MTNIIKNLRSFSLIDLFLLGHMCWGYITGKMSSSILHVNVNPYLILFLAILPDIDLFLGVFGLRHRTWTHSILIWSMIFVPIFIKYKVTAIPYFISVIQHIVLGDFIVGERNYPLWPVSMATFSLGFGPVSAMNIALEGIGLAIFTIIILVGKDLRRTFFGLDKRNILSILLLIPLIGFTTAAYSYNFFIDFLIENNIVRASSLVRNIESITSNQLFPFVAGMHIILACILSISLFQGLRASKLRVEYRDESHK